LVPDTSQAKSEIAIEESMMKIIPQLEKCTPYGALFSNIAILLELLGTIMGLIVAFAAVANANPAEKADLLSASISVAMNTTHQRLRTDVRDSASALPCKADINYRADRGQPGECALHLFISPIKMLNTATTMVLIQTNHEEFEKNQNRRQMVSPYLTFLLIKVRILSILLYECNILSLIIISINSIKPDKGKGGDS
jgi:hypothetical protein